MKDRLTEMWLCHGVKLSLLASLCLGLALYGLLYALHQVFFLGEVFFSGLFVGLLWLLLHLSTLHSFGVPVLREAAPGGSGQEDSYFRTPWQKMRRAGRFIAEETNEE